MFIQYEKQTCHIDFWQIWYFEVKGRCATQFHFDAKLWEDSICEYHLTASHFFLEQTNFLMAEAFYFFGMIFFAVTCEHFSSAASFFSFTTVHVGHHADVYETTQLNRQAYLGLCNIDPDTLIRARHSTKSVCIIGVNQGN